MKSTALKLEKETIAPPHAGSGEEFTHGTASRDRGSVPAIFGQEFVS